MAKFINEETEKQLREQFGLHMKNDVDIKIFTRSIILAPAGASALEGEKELNEFAVSFINELAAIEPRIKVEQAGFDSELAKKFNLTVSPSILIGSDKGYKIIYSGAPYGYEGASFIETIFGVSAGETPLLAENKELIKYIEKETKIQTFVTAECPYCPTSVILANRIAIESKGMVISECVESYENQALAQKYKVSAVPEYVVNGREDSILVGVQPEKLFILYLLQYSAPEKYNSIVAGLEAKRKVLEILPDKPEKTIYISDNNFKEAVKKYPNLIVDCWADWCGPCKMMAPILEELAAEYKDKIVMGKMNVDENPATSQEYAVKSIPTTLVFKNGEKAGEIVGAMAKVNFWDEIRKYYGI